jgi:DNA-binding NarL/FixJ family response regulator
MLTRAWDSAELRVVGEAAGDVASPDPVPAEADVVLVADEDLLEGLELTNDGTQALVLLSEDDHAVAVLRSLPLRGWGLIPPDAAPEELSAAIEAAARGLVAFPEALSERLLGEPAAVEEPLEPLTGREREVLELLSRGLPNKLIARELGISEHTVKFHVSSVFVKLGASSRAEAVALGARLGLITL